MNTQFIQQTTVLPAVKTIKKNVTVRKIHNLKGLRESWHSSHEQKRVHTVLTVMDPPVLRMLQIHCMPKSGTKSNWSTRDVRLNIIQCLSHCSLQHAGRPSL